MREQVETGGRDPAAERQGRPPRAVVGSTRIEEEIFGRAFDGQIMRRIWRFVAPLPAADAGRGGGGADLHRHPAPHPAHHPPRHRPRHGAGGGPGGADLGVRRLRCGRSSSTSSPAGCRRRWSARSPSTCSSTCAAPCSRHLQRVSLSFMDKTEVGRLMSRLQGDVNSMQEFLETSVLSVGDIALLFGIVGVMLALDWQLGAPHPLGDAGPLRRPADLAAAGARGLHGGARDAARRRTARWPRASTACARCRAWTASASTSCSTTTRRGPTSSAHLPAAALRPGHGADRRHADRHRHGRRDRRRRRAGARPRARRRRDGGLPLLHPALLRPDPLADHAVFGDAARDGLRPPHHRGARRAGRGRGPAGRHRRSARTWTARSSSAT